MDETAIHLRRSYFDDDKPNLFLVSAAASDLNRFLACHRTVVAVRVDEHTWVHGLHPEKEEHWTWFRSPQFVQPADGASTSFCGSVGSRCHTANSQTVELWCYSLT